MGLLYQTWWQQQHLSLKAYLVACSFIQIYSIDRDETFAPVTQLETICLLLALAVNKDWEIHQINIKTAYLYGDLNKEIYMEPPPGLPVPKGHALCLLKAIYGLK